MCEQKVMVFMCIFQAVLYKGGIPNMYFTEYWAVVSCRVPIFHFSESSFLIRIL